MSQTNVGSIESTEVASVTTANISPESVKFVSRILENRGFPAAAIALGEIFEGSLETSYDWFQSRGVLIRAFREAKLHGDVRETISKAINMAKENSDVAGEEELFSGRAPVMEWFLGHIDRAYDAISDASHAPERLHFGLAQKAKEALVRAEAVRFSDHHYAAMERLMGKGDNDISDTLRDCAEIGKDVLFEDEGNRAKKFIELILQRANERVADFRYQVDTQQVSHQRHQKQGIGGPGKTERERQKGIDQARKAKERSENDRAEREERKGKNPGADKQGKGKQSKRSAGDPNRHGK